MSIPGEMTREEERDAARIAARRQREAERVARFLNDPFGRQVGIDQQALEQQIREKREADALRQNQAEEEAEQARRMAALLEARELERQAKIKETKGSLHAAWAESIAMKNAQLERERRQAKNAVQRSGIRFVGEDPLRGERKRMQQIQVQHWTAQQIAAKEQVAEKAAKENQKYIGALHAMEQQANRADAEKLEAKKREAMRVRQENEMAARLRREQASRERKQSLRTTGSQVAIEDTFRSLMANEFKGLTSEQRRRVQEENAAVMAAKVAQRQKEQQEKEEYASMLRAQATYAERSHLEAQERAKKERIELAAVLQQQQMEARQQREAERKRNSSNAFEDGFFAGFGRSSR